MLGVNFDEIIAGFRSLRATDFDENNPAMEGPERLEHLVQAVEKLPQPEFAMQEMFAVMERLPESHLGSPGPLVHCLEAMRAYEEQLSASVLRAPVPLSIWMVNRILNSKLTPEKRRFYLDLLTSVATHPRASDSARAEAKHFMEFQAKKNH